MFNENQFLISSRDEIIKNLREENKRLLNKIYLLQDYILQNVIHNDIKGAGTPISIKLKSEVKDE